MIFKSYLVESNFQTLNNNIALFYGENLGLIDDFKQKIKRQNQNIEIQKYTQDEILKNQKIIINEISNDSLFEEIKIIFINEVNDKIFFMIEEIHEHIKNNKIYLFGNILEKKSKLRSYAEKSKNFDVVACYKDNEIHLKKIIIDKLKQFSGVSTETVNMLLENCGLDRAKLKNEIDKIISFFKDKNIKIDQLNEILNQRVDEDFTTIKDAALIGNKKMTNKLLSSTIFENEKMPLYISLLNQRLNKLREIACFTDSKNSLDLINNFKPPIFWKDKPTFIEQSKRWNEDKTNSAINKTYEFEMKLKSNADIDKNLLIKKLLIDLCILANLS